MPTRKRAQLGDVIQITTAAGIAYAQLTHRDRLFGCMLRILPGLHHANITDISDLINRKESFHVFVFEDDLHEPPIMQIVAHKPIPEAAKAYPLFRDGVKDPKTGRVQNWWLWDGMKSWRIGELQESQRDLPIREILNYKILAERLGKGWKPSLEY